MQFDPDKKGATKINPSGSGGEVAEIRDVCDVLREIMKENNDTNQIMIKMDCEGGEFEILERLSEQKELLQKINVLAIEWHFKGPEKLINILKQSAFKILETHRIDDTVGMIYAFK